MFFFIIILKRLIFSILISKKSWSRRNNPVTFSRDIGFLARDEFLVIRKGYHIYMLIYIFIVFYCWALYCTALIGMDSFQSWIDYNNLSHIFLESSPLVEQCMADSISNGSEYNGQTSRFSFFFMPKYPNNTLTVSVLTSRTSRRLFEEKASVNNFVRIVLSAERQCCK